MGFDWARSPMIGGSRTGVDAGAGACQDENAFGGHCMFANGFANPASPDPSLVLPPPNGSFGRDSPPRPAFCKAILVPILFKKDMVVLGAYERASLGERGALMNLQAIHSRWEGRRNES